LCFAVNYRAGSLFAHLLLPVIKQSAPARIVNVSLLGQQPDARDSLCFSL
jgi:NAD(P)-dependent dehydrogenase (short-subunit alcohol dehydrogenase family)